MSDLTVFLNSVSPVTLVVILAVMVLMIMALVITLVKQNSQIKKLQYALQPKYGFLGKTLPVMVLVLLAGVSVGLSVYLSTSQQGNIKVNADKRVDLNTTVTVRAQNEDGTFPVVFMLVPRVDGVDWDVNNSSAKFDAFWEVSGQSKFSQIEYALTATNTGGFVKNLPAGAYKLNLGVLYGGKLWQKSTNFTVP